MQNFLLPLLLFINCIAKPTVNNLPPPNPQESEWKKSLPEGVRTELRLSPHIVVHANYFSASSLPPSPPPSLPSLPILQLAVSITNRAPPLSLRLSFPLPPSSTHFTLSGRRGGRRNSRNSEKSGESFFFF